MTCNSFKQSLNYLFSILFLLSVLSCDRDSNKGFTDLNIAYQVDSIGNVCWQLREIETDSSLQLGLKALKLADSINYTQGITQTCNYIGVLYGHYFYEYRKAIPYFHRAMELSLVSGDSIELAYAYNNLSYIYLETNNTTLSLKNGLNALEIFEKLNNQVGLAYVYISLGNIYREKKEFEKSLNYFKQAISIRNKISPLARQRSAIFNVGKTYEVAGELDSALVYYTKALAEEDLSKISRYGSLCLNGIANIYCINGEFDLALDHYKKAIEWDRFRRHNFGIIDNFIGMALVYAHKDNYQEGINLLNKALQMALSPSLESQKINVYKSFINFYKIRGNFEKASQYFDLFLAEYDSIFSDQQIEIVAELENNFNINQDLELAEHKLETDKLLKIRLIIIICLMVAVLIILIWQYRSSKKMSTQLSEINKTKDKMFSVISHDMRGPFNSLVGFSDLLNTALDNKDYQQAKDFAEILKTSSNEGKELIDRLLNWSMTHNGKIHFSPELIDISRLFSKLEKHFFDRVENNKVKLLFENKLTEKILADPHIINIIMNNLITNAFKYTPKDGTISVSACLLNSSHLKIEVKDTGIGMSEEMINKLLDKKNFIESKKGLREEKGSGLGLNIINELLNVHHGSMKLTSKEGEGTTIELIFPLED